MNEMTKMQVTPLNLTTKKYRKWMIDKFYIPDSLNQCQTKHINIGDCTDHLAVMLNLKGGDHKKRKETLPLETK